MGSGNRGNFGKTKGSSIAEMVKKDNIITKEKDLIKELKSNNIKFNKDEMKFITKDSSGQTIWLESGNSFAGFKHIIERHGNDFKKAFDINSEQIPSKIKKVITNGKIINTSENKIGYTKVYKYKSKYYLVTGIGYNGFIVSAYPYDKKGGKYDKD